MDITYRDVCGLSSEASYARYMKGSQEHEKGPTPPRQPIDDDLRYGEYMVESPYYIIIVELEDDERKTRVRFLEKDSVCQGIEPWMCTYPVELPEEYRMKKLQILVRRDGVLYTTKCRLLARCYRELLKDEILEALTKPAKFIATGTKNIAASSLAYYITWTRVSDPMEADYSVKFPDWYTLTPAEISHWKADMCKLGGELVFSPRIRNLTDVVFYHRDRELGLQSFRPYAAIREPVKKPDILARVGRVPFMDLTPEEQAALHEEKMSRFTQPSDESHKTDGDFPRCAIPQFDGQDD